MFIRISEDMRATLNSHVVDLITAYKKEVELCDLDPLNRDQTLELSYIVNQLMDEIEENI